jgi:hypothetical protein
MHEQNMIQNEEDLQSIVDNLQAFLDFNAATSGNMDVTIRVGQGYIDLDWLEKHKEHRLAVRCEYESWEELEKRRTSGLSWWKAKRLF